jgi:hypothetical protein
MFNENQFDSIKTNIQNIYNADEVDKKLQLCMGICEMMLTQQLSPDTESIIKRMSSYSQRLLKDEKFRKAIWKRNAIVKMEAMTYFGDDLQKGDMYDYDESIERDIVKIDFEITSFVANVQSHIMRSDNVM